MRKPPLQLVPSAGRKLSEVDATVDLLILLVVNLMASVFSEAPNIRNRMLADLKAIRKGSKLSPKQKAIYDQAIQVIEDIDIS